MTSVNGGDGSALLRKSAEGAKFLIILQVGSRALTFAVNQILLRYLSPELLGISTQLEVYSISVLFFAREALRVAIQRQTEVPRTKESAGKTSDATAQSREVAKTTQGIVNLAYVSICLGLLFAFVLQSLYLRSLRSRPLVLNAPYFASALQIYGAAALLELLAEPGFVVVQQRSHYKTRAAAETTATLLRCIVTCVSAIWSSKTDTIIGVLPFAFGQFAYGMALLVVYWGSVWQLSSTEGFHLVPKVIGQAPHIIHGLFPRSLLILGTSLFMQGLVKHILTQGDVIMISYMSSLEDQGIYALASNYGGLVARMVFQPIEESSRNYFGKLLSSVDREVGPKEVRVATEHLQQLLRVYILLSISAAAVGPTVAPMLLGIIAGPRWTTSGAGLVLAKYCYYIPLLAINGVTEAFISAVASKSELNRQSVWMVAFSGVFAVAGYVFLRVLKLGAEGLVWANLMNMAFRIVWSGRFIRRYLQHHGCSLSIPSLLPNPMTIAAGLGTAAVMFEMQKRLTDSIWDFLMIGTVCGIYSLTLAISERRYLLQMYKSFNNVDRK